jgi:hypothetical protein
VIVRQCAVVFDRNDAVLLDVGSVDFQVVHILRSHDEQQYALNKKRPALSGGSF